MQTHSLVLGNWLTAGTQIFNNARRSAAEIERDENRLVAIHAEMKALSEAAEAEAREPTADEDSKLRLLWAEFATIENRVTRDRVAEDEHNRTRGTGRRSDPDDMAAGRRPGALPSARSEPEMRMPCPPPGANGRRYADLFAKARRPSPVDRIEPPEFLRLLANGIADPRMILAAQSEGTGADGGFEVPLQLMKAIIDSSLTAETVRPRAYVIPMSSNSLGIPMGDIFDRSSKVANIRSAWVGEGETPDLQTGKLTQVTLKASKLMTLLALSNELIADSLSAGQIFADLMAAEVSYNLDGAFLLGTGAGQPAGILNAASLITVLKESGQAADTVLFQNILNMWSRLHPACQANAAWWISASVTPQLLGMSFDPGADSPQPIFSVGGTTQSPTMTLMGRPVIVSEHLPMVGDKGDILLADASRYAIGMRGNMLIDRSTHARFASDEQLFRLTLRIDGRPMWSKVVTPKAGGPTLSWAVALEERTGS